MVVIILKCISDSFLPKYLEPHLDFLTSVFKTIYRSSSPQVLYKKGVLLQICSIFIKEYTCRSVISMKLSYTFAWMFFCKLSKYSQNTFLEKHIWVTASVYMKVNTAYDCRHSLVQTPERQNQRRFGVLIVNYQLQTDFAPCLVPFQCPTLSMYMSTSLNFKLLVIFWIENKKNRSRIRTPRSSMMELFVIL